MELVGAGARDHIDDRGAGKTILGAEVGLLHLELAHRFRRGCVDCFRDAAIGLKVGHRCAVHQNVGRGAAAAVGHKVRPTAVLTLVVHLRNTGRQEGQVHHVAIHERQVVDELSIDHLAGGRIFGTNR